MSTVVSIKPSTQKDYSHVVEWREAGKRRRMFFTTLGAAQTEKRRQVSRLGKIPTDEPPTEPDEFRAVLEARDAGVPLMAAVEHWRRTAGAHGGRTMADLFDARLAAAEKDHLSPGHAKSLIRVLDRARQAMGGMPAASVTALDCQAFIASWHGHHSQKQGRAILGSVFAHAQRMGWLQHNPAAVLKLARQKATAGVSVFTPDKAAEWLCCVAAHAPSCLAGWALALFAGLRRAEVERLEWSEVRMDRGLVEITAGKSKTRTRRLVDILPNLATILEPLAGTGRVFPLSPKRAEAHAFKAYGRPPKNIARHSFISYHLALFGDLALTEMQAGHDRAVLFQHYRELVTQADAESYFTITV